MSGFRSAGLTYVVMGLSGLLGGGVVCGDRSRFGMLRWWHGGMTGRARKERSGGLLRWRRLWMKSIDFIEWTDSQSVLDDLHVHG